jgi:Pyridoxamine 5'-phosphate oxidase
VSRKQFANGANCATASDAPTRRRIIAWSAVALGSFAIAPAFTVVDALAQPAETAAGMNVHVTQRDIDALKQASLLYIATVRKDGNQSTAAPVWFTVALDHSIYIQTRPATWKAKRIRRGSPVIVWIGKRSGPAFIGKAEISGAPAVARQIVQDYPKRYLMARLGLHTPTQAMFDKGEILAIKITPVHDLPEGFASRPGTPAPSLAGAASNA